MLESRPASLRSASDARLVPVSLWVLSLVMAGCSGDGTKAHDAGGAAGDGDGAGDDDAGHSGDGDADAPGDGDADAATFPPDSREAFCAGQGPAITVEGEGPMATCSGRIAAQTFTYALCTCANTQVLSLQTDSFDSLSGMSTTMSGAPVGINGQYANSGLGSFGGSLTISGGNLSFSSMQSVSGDLRVQGAVTGAGALQVERDAYVGGAITTVGGGTIGRNLYQPATATNLGVSVSGAKMPEAVSVADPCACDPAQLLDVAGFITKAAVKNDNADVPYDFNELRNVVGALDREIPCGRFYLEGMDVGGDLTLRVNGRTALFVSGDINVSGSLEVILGDKGELDLFIGGHLALAGPSSFGNTMRPLAVRIYMGGSGTVALGSGSAFVGNLYAPLATVASAGSLEVYGSIFAKELSAIDTKVHYDRGILEVGKDCDVPPPTTCERCGDCADGKACVNGSCGACRTDSDCCQPLVCLADGSCGGLLL